MAEENSEELWRRSRAGDADALGALLARQLPALRAFVRTRMSALLRSHVSESDVVQSGCLELLRHAPDFDYRGEAEFRAWLRTAVLRKVQKRERYLRAARRDVRRHATPDAGAPDAGAAGDAAAQSPVRQLIGQERMQLLEVALEQLPPHYREVIALSRIARLPRTEVARRMQRTEASVRNLLSRALVALAEVLDEPCNGDDASRPGHARSSREPAEGLDPSAESGIESAPTDAGPSADEP